MKNQYLYDVEMWLNIFNDVDETQNLKACKVHLNNGEVVTITGTARLSNVGVETSFNYLTIDGATSNGETEEHDMYIPLSSVTYVELIRKETL